MQPATNPNSMSLGDYNHDNKIDLVVANINF